MAILVSSSSGSAEDVVGEVAVEEEVLIESAWPPDFREFITLFHSCLYTFLTVFLLCSSKPSQVQNWDWNCCASLTMVTRGSYKNLVAR